jgi:hypothetical protein
LARLLPLEQLLGIPRKFENLYALVHVRLFGRLVPRDFAQAVVLRLAPLSRYHLEERAVHAPVEFVEIPACILVLSPYFVTPYGIGCRSVRSPTGAVGRR